MPSANPTIGVRVSDELYQAVRTAADAQGRSMSNLVDMILRDHLLKRGVQVDIEEAIAATATPSATRKRSPSKRSKHK
jgi:hypothetical protein